MLVLFDIDGTLVHAGGAGRAALESAMVEIYGTAGPIDKLPFDGLTDPQIACTLLSAAGFDEELIDKRLDALWVAYLNYLGSELVARRADMEAYPGVLSLLAALNEIGVTVGLVTGNISGGAHGKLEACGLGGRFLFGAFGSDAADRNDLPPIAIERAFTETGIHFASEETWIVGDTPQDITCAKASGLRVLAVATGRFSVAELKEAGADWAVPSLDRTADVMTILTSSGRAK
jgi:phosphoglycolate phosphatase